VLFRSGAVFLCAESRAGTQQICTAQANFQPIYFASDRLQGIMFEFESKTRSVQL
jgi:hypothetical protein